MNLAYERGLPFEDRVLMYHEAGHAVAAMHYGKKILSIGIHEMPHCLINPLGLTRHQKGVLLAAGAMMTKEVFGVEYGTATDYAMAKELGDLEEFKAEASKICKKMLPAATTIVHGRLGEPDKYSLDHGRVKAPMTPELQEIIKGTRLSRFLRKAIIKMGRLQMGSKCTGGAVDARR